MYLLLNCSSFLRRTWPNNNVRLPIQHFVQNVSTTSTSLSKDDGNGNENITRKYIFISFVPLRDYFNSLNLYKKGELSRNQNGRSGVQVKEENEKFIAVRTRSPQNLKCGHSRCFAEDGKEMYQNVNRTCRAIAFAHLTYCFAALWLSSPPSTSLLSAVPTCSVL